MKESIRVYLLRILAVTAVSAFIYPVVLVARTALFKDDGGIISFLLYLAFLSAGFAAGRLLLKEDAGYTERIAGLRAVKLFMYTFSIKEDRRFIATISAIATIPVIPAASSLIFYTHGIFRAVFEILPAIIPYALALKSSLRGFDEIMNRNISVTGLIIIAASIETSNYYSPVRYLMPYLYVFAYFGILSFLILKNQEDIDYNIYNKKHVEKAILPGNLRSYNLKAVFVLFAVILLSFYLKPIVLFMMDIGGKIAGFALKAILWIMQHIFPRQDIQEQQGTAPADPGFFGGGAEVIHPVANLISNTLMKFVLIYTAYWLIRIIIRKLPALVNVIAALLRKLFSWSKSKDIIPIGDYSDEIETVRPEKNRDRRHEIGSRLKNARKDLKLIKDPVEKVRFIYGSLLGMLFLFGIKPEKSDTAAEILAKARLVHGLGRHLSPLSLIYEDVRYGSVIPDSNTLSKAMEYYAGASELLKHMDSR